MKLCDILRVKGMDVHCIGPDAPLSEVVQELVRFNVGSLIVCEPASRGVDVRVIGIITERDVLRTLAKRDKAFAELRVGDVMSNELITAEPDDRIGRGMQMMTNHRIRHLPIMSDGRLLGIVSIGDIVKSLHDELEMQNHVMSSYIRGETVAMAMPPGEHH